MSKPKHPFCYICGWRKGGVDSWDGKACKCGHSAPPLITCPMCHGRGSVPYNIGQETCTKCDGSGLVP